MLHPYVVVDSGRDFAEVIAENNTNNYYAMGSHRSADEAPGALVAASMSEYAALLRSLKAGGVQFVTAAEQRDASIRHRVQLRHDVDGDLAAALVMAETEAHLGIRSTYFLLHTAPYYGSWHEPPGDPTVFRRNECLGDGYRRLQELGHEVALHTDPFGVCQDHDTDGADALVTELDWLRGLGLTIDGTAPHNSYTVYGADNSSVFIGRPWRPGASPTERPDGTDHLPLHSLSEAELGLGYEANEPLDSPEPLHFFSITNSDRWARYFQDFSRLDDAQVREHRDPASDGAVILRRFYPDVFVDDSSFVLTTESVEKAVLTTRPESLVIMSIHPEYYGRRTEETAWPTPAGSSQAG